MTRVSALVAAAVLAPVVLAPTAAAAADGPQPPGVSAPDATPTTEEQDRAEVRRILADPETGRGVREAAQKALEGGAAELRHFLEVELPAKQAEDNRVKVFRILATGGPAVQKAAQAALSGSYEDLLRFLKTGQFVARAEDEDRAEVQRILADPETGRGVREAAQKVVDGTAAELRHFLEAEFPGLQLADNQLKVAQLMNGAGPAVREAARVALNGTAEDLVQFLKVGQFVARAEDQDRAEVQRILADPSTGRRVREAAQKVVDGTAAELRHFLTVDLPVKRESDDRVRVSQLMETGGPEVKKAALAAWNGTYQDIQQFLAVGQYEAEAKDRAATEAAAQAAAKAKADQEAAAEAARKAAGVTQQTGTTATTVSAATGTTATGTTTTTGTSGRGTTATGTGTTTVAATSGTLAATGAGDALGWEVGGAAAALAAGAALVVVSRRRLADES